MDFEAAAKRFFRGDQPDPFNDFLILVQRDGDSGLELISCLVEAASDDADLCLASGMLEELIAHHWTELDSRLERNLKTDSRWRRMASCIEWSGLPTDAEARLIPLIGTDVYDESIRKPLPDIKWPPLPWR